MLKLLLPIALLPTAAFASQGAAHGDPVAAVVLALTIILVAAKLGGEVAVRVGQSAVLGELLVGVLLGFFTLGASSGVGSSAIQIAKGLGALFPLPGGVVSLQDRGVGGITQKCTGSERALGVVLELGGHIERFDSLAEPGGGNPNRCRENQTDAELAAAGLGPQLVYNADGYYTYAPS